jgi:nitrogen fixation NifU-like protein
VDRQAQIDFILDHYENPRHYGPLENPSVIQKGGNPGCGDVVTFYLSVDGDDQVSEISFEGDGCTISLAASSVVTEMFTGKTLAEIEATSSEAILEILGREIAGTRLKCATLGLNTTKEAVRMLRREVHLQPRVSTILPVLGGTHYLGGALRREEIHDDARQEDVA